MFCSQRGGSGGKEGTIRILLHQSSTNGEGERWECREQQNRVAAEKGGGRGGRGSRKGLPAAIDKLTMASTLHIRPLRPLEADKFQIYSTSTTGEVDLST